MSVVIFVAVLLAAAVPLAVLARRRLIAERRRAALTPLQEQMTRMAREFERAAEVMGRALIPSMHSAAAAVGNFAAAFRAAIDDGPPDA